MTTQKAKTAARMTAAERKKMLELIRVAEAAFSRSITRLDAHGMRLENEAEGADPPEGAAPASPRTLETMARETDKALLSVVDLQAKLIERLGETVEVGAATGAAVIDLTEARNEIARRLDRLAA